MGRRATTHSKNWLYHFMTSPMTLTPITRDRPVDRVTDALRRSILGGEAAPDTLLPPERELAVALGVARPTLRAALAHLEAEGLVRARQGEGVRVLDPLRHGTVDLLRHLPLRPDVVSAALEVRRALAAEAVALASARASAADRAALRALADAQRATTDAAAWIDGDLAFTRRLLEATGNVALVLLFNSLEGAWRAHPALSAALAADRDAALAATSSCWRCSPPPRPDARELVRSALEGSDAAAHGRVFP